MQSYNFDQILDRTNTASSKWDKYPADVLPLWVADTDFKAPQPVIDALTQRVTHGAFGYTWEHGSFERSTQGWVQRRYHWDIELSWVHFSPSVATSIGIVVRAFTRPGDNVVFQAPVYSPFFVQTQNNGRVPLANPLQRSNTWSIDFDDLETTLSDPKTTLLLLCSPHNPSGRSFSERELTRMGELCLKHGVRVFSDEIHADFVFSGKHTPFAKISKKFAEISATCVSPSKIFNMADLRTSALIVPGEENRTRIKQQLAAARLGRNSLGILAYDVAYGGQCDDYADQVKTYLEKNLDRAVAHINRAMPGIRAYKPEATFLLWLDCRELGLPQAQLEAFFVDQAKVALNSGLEFGPEGEGFMRLNVACPAPVLSEALTRMERAVQKLGVKNIS